MLRGKLTLLMKPDVTRRLKPPDGAKREQYAIHVQLLLWREIEN
jgi:hypothetical protein